MSETDTLGIILAFAGVCVVNGAAVAVVWIQGKTRSDRTDSKIDDVGTEVNIAAGKADIVAKRVEPVSNGFANEVRSGLAAIRAEQQESRAEMQAAIGRLDAHLGDHARADVRRRKR